MHDTYVWLSVAVIALTTALLRFLPFLIWKGEKQTPRIIEKLGRMLPYAIMGMLVVYCLKDMSFGSASGFMPSVAACLVVGILYVWKRNTLISILAGTVSYMVLVQMIF